VTFTLKLPPVVPVQARLAVPGEGGSVTLVGLSERERPEGEIIESVTVPLKPPCWFTLIVEPAEEPALRVTVVGLAEMLKSSAACTPVTITKQKTMPIITMQNLAWASGPLPPVRPAQGSHTEL
jgi:hypothetical protein